MGAERGDPIVVRPRRGINALTSWVKEKPRDALATALVALTALTGFAPAVTSATTAAASNGAQASHAGDDPEANEAPAPPADPAYYAVIPTPRPAAGPIPLGKGMWVHKLHRAANGDPGAIVNQALSAGLTHLYIRVGSSKSGFYAQRDLDRLLPVAHAAGLKVVGWDFPYLNDVAADVERARQQIWYVTPTGHRIDAYSADIETGSEGTHLTAEGVFAYGASLRNVAGEGYPLIATVPRPSPKRWFPFNALGAFDAIAPMVYWGNRDPGTDVAGAIAALKPYGKPILPVGQAYDMAQDGAPRVAHGAPSKAAVQRFISTATGHGALGVSLWVWDTADANHWAALAESKHFDLAAAAAAPAPQPEQVVYLQRVLTGLGHPTPVDGQLTPATQAALSNLQRAEGLQPTGKLDEQTVSALLQPATGRFQPPAKAGR